MKTIPFELAKAQAGAKVVTQVGKPVRLLAFDALGEYPIVGLVADGTGECAQQWTESGAFYTKSEASPKDLFLVSEPKVVPYDRDSIPLPLVVRDNEGQRTIVQGASLSYVSISGWVNHTYEALLAKFTHDDGTPCGRVEE